MMVWGPSLIIALYPEPYPKPAPLTRWDVQIFLR